MATPVARSLFNDGKASLRLIRTSLLRRSNTSTVKDQSLLAPSGIILGQCQIQNPSRTVLDRQVKASAPHLFGRSLLVGGEDGWGLGRKYCLTAEDGLEMRQRKEISDEDDGGDFGSDDGDYDSDDAGDLGDFDKADFDDDDGKGDDDDEDEEFDLPRKRRK